MTNSVLITRRSLVQIQPPQPWALRGKTSRRPSYFRPSHEPVARRAEVLLGLDTRLKLTCLRLPLSDALNHQVRLAAKNPRWPKSCVLLCYHICGRLIPYAGSAFQGTAAALGLLLHEPHSSAPSARPGGAAEH